MSGPVVQPYLFFSGRCEEAIEFYKQAIGAELLMKMRFNESPDPTPPGMLEQGFETKIMHATLKVGESIVMAPMAATLKEKSMDSDYRSLLITKSTLKKHSKRWHKAVQ